MLIPWNTDAPIYHFPFVTIGLIVVNTAVFVVTLQADDPTPWLLEFGNGLQPVQWVTNVFMHADIMHLLGNMLFLWAFGLVIEGKLGWWRFLLVYLGLGATESAVAQICMLNQFGYALGASGAIYGLLAIALIWAPKNDLTCLATFGFRAAQLEIPILAFVSFYVGLEIFGLWRNQFEMSSELLHLLGAIPGFVVGIALLKLGIVDCENWDIFAVFQGREGEAKKVKKKTPDPKKTAVAQKNLADQRQAAMAQFNTFLTQGRAAEALAVHNRMSRVAADWQLTPPQMLALIKSLHKQRLWSQSVAPMTEYLKRVPEAPPRICLSLAQILLEHEERPGRALRVLDKIPQDALDGDLRRFYDQLEQRARKAYAEADLELELDE